MRLNSPVRLSLALAGFVALMATAGCQGPLLHSATVSSDTIRPNAQGDTVFFRYSVSEIALVSITLEDESGNRWWLRQDEPRSAGDYVARFDGTTVPEQHENDRLVLPNGEYRWEIQAESRASPSIISSESGILTVVDADTELPDVTQVVIEPKLLQPNGDGTNDETVISYAVSKAALVDVYVTDADGRSYVLDIPTEREASLQSHRWNGQSNGRLLPDGEYVVHIRAQDKAGNVIDRTGSVTLSQGGLPKLVITSARFTPISVPRGGVLNVEITVENVGDVPIYTLGPLPGTTYTTQMTFNSFRSDDPNAPPKFFERAGVWRVGVDWESSGRPYPVRWALTDDLDKPILPGEESTITGTIEVLIDRTTTVVFWASIVQEGVGFPGGRVGLTRITISF